jgi:fatty-acyl-CoA synthase
MSAACCETSYVCGLADKPLLHLTIGGLLSRAAEAWPDREALVVRHQNIRVGYRDFDREVDSLARGLLACGLTPGDRVGIWAQNCAEWVLIQFATARAGLILVTINPAYRTGELEYALRKVGCRMLIFAGVFKSSDYGAMIRSLIPPSDLVGGGRVLSSLFPELEFLVRVGEARGSEFMPFARLQVLGDLADGGRLEAVGRALDPDQPVNIQFTSGTTGLPKGATLTHFNIVNNAYFAGEGMKLTPRDRLCIPVPLYHCFGMVLGALTAVAHGAAMVFPSEAFDAASVLETIQAERCTVLHGVPTMFIAALEHPRFEDYDLTSLRTGIMAGSPCPEALMHRVIAGMNMAEVTIGYGMTETSPISFQTGIEDSLERRVSTVGRVHPHVQVKIVDVTGNVVPRGVGGELLTRGYSVMRGYWNDPERSAQAVDEAGWMRTGDLALLDVDGFCNIVGRVKDMIIRGGENIFPREIEEFLYRHPKILDVAVVGLPDVKYGEEVCAVIRLQDGETADAEEIRAFCRERIAHYKIPRYIRFVGAFPMTITGKIQKYILREQMQRAFEEGTAQPA